MKKLIIPAVLAAILLTASCGKGKTSAPSVSPAATVSGTALPKSSPHTSIDSMPGSGSASASSKTADDGTDSPAGNDNAASEDKDSDTVESGEITEPNDTDDTDDTERPDSISIINGSSIPFSAVYLSTSSNGNPGENIIGDTPLGEGEEIVLPFANAPDEELNIIVEDENGIQYSAGGISLANGLTIELRLNGGVLEAIAQ